MDESHVGGVQRTFPKKGKSLREDNKPKSERHGVIKNHGAILSKRKTLGFSDDMPVVKKKVKLSKKKKALKKKNFQEKLDEKYGNGVQHAAIVTKRRRSRKKADAELIKDPGNKYGSVEHQMLGGDSDDKYSDIDVSDMLEKESDGEEAGIPMINGNRNKFSIPQRGVPLEVSDSDEHDSCPPKGQPLDFDDSDEEYEPRISTGVTPDSDEDDDEEQADRLDDSLAPAVDDDDSSDDDFEKSIHNREKGASTSAPANPDDSDFDERPDEDEVASEAFREQLSNMPLSEVRKMKEKLGIKLFNKAFFGSTEADLKNEQEKRENNRKREFKRENANRPREMSSKRPVTRLRDVYANDKKTKRPGFDPRFDERCGQFDETHYKDSYSFLGDIRAKEKEVLRKGAAAARAAGDLRKAERMREVLKKMENQDKNKKVVEMKRQTIRELKKENIERMKNGLAPVFKTKAQVRERNMEKKFKQLKAEHGVDKYLVRQSKKQLVKERKESEKQPWMRNDE